ncbi:MAG: hypothetical protein CVT88_03395 [Candidatus Altiarchaeales archaeon HGW-Altiarchaeales-1]|nr:MAG: hypothetical protein CVT88_03395 [Candidatus Altiarchaeales archaeon HGW-Altiarchaeales-1]
MRIIKRTFLYDKKRENYLTPFGDFKISAILKHSEKRKKQTLEKFKIIKYCGGSQAVKGARFRRRTFLF